MFKRRSSFRRRSFGRKRFGFRSRRRGSVGLRMRRVGQRM